MPNGFALEICVESVERAIAAERGGANRVELCCDLASDGITPSAGMMQVARRKLRIPIHVLIRPRAGNFVYSDREFEIMERDIDFAKQMSMDGIVLGVLDGNSRVDVKRTAHLVKLASPLPVTFHRAFDLCDDMNSALEAVIQTGSARLLTSGGSARAMQHLDSLARLVGLAGTRITVMPGGGISADDIPRILRETSAREIHTSLRAYARGAQARLSESDRPDSREVEFELAVRRVRTRLDSLSREPLSSQ
jgi:copper homeostasis protein